MKHHLIPPALIAICALTSVAHADPSVKLTRDLNVTPKVSRYRFTLEAPYTKEKNEVEFRLFASYGGISKDWNEFGKISNFDKANHAKHVAFDFPHAPNKHRVAAYLKGPQGWYQVQVHDGGEGLYKVALPDGQEAVMSFVGDQGSHPRPNSRTVNSASTRPPLLR